MKTRIPALLLLCCASARLAHAQETETVWKCIDPDEPFRFVSSENQKTMPPPCGKWLEIRGPGLRALFEAVSNRQISASANLFLRDAGEAARVPYPQTPAGQPARNSDAYSDPAVYGFVTTSAGAAPPGAIVLWGDMGGLLVETRESPGGSWIKKVLSAGREDSGALAVSDLTAFGQSPKILVRN